VWIIKKVGSPGFPEGGIVMHTSRFHIVVVALLLVGVSATLLARDQKSVNHEDQSKAVNVIRLINAAELWYNKGINTKPGAIEAHGRYASWDELYNSGVLTTVQDEIRSQARLSNGHGLVFTLKGSDAVRNSLQWAMVKDLQVSAGPEVMPGYRLDLLVSIDGKSYSLALHDTRDGDGLFSVFSDQSGIIFLGSPLQ
jgi:hypothetical protein